MATIFLEPGGDADFGFGFWSSTPGAPSIVTDIVHGSHIKSIKCAQGGTGDSVQKAGVLVDAGGRVSFYLYVNVYPTSVTTTFLNLYKSDGSSTVLRLRMTTTGVLQIWEASSQLGSDGSTLSTGIWYRISYVWKVTSSTVNSSTLFVNGASSTSQTNSTLTNTSMDTLRIGNNGQNGAFDLRLSDIYLDNSNALTDPGNIWVTAKRPNANGTTNGFTTQIGSGGSGYGTGHSPQVNERPNSDSNGWSVIGAGSAVTEEYNIESASTGDIDISKAGLVDYMGWVRTKALAAETGQIIINNVNSNISITTSPSFLTQIAGSTTYPAGTGTDIGEITSSTVTTVSLYEAGMIMAFTTTSTSSSTTTSTSTTSTSSSTSITTSSSTSTSSTTTSSSTSITTSSSTSTSTTTTSTSTSLTTSSSTSTSTTSTSSSTSITTTTSTSTSSTTTSSSTSLTTSSSTSTSTTTTSTSTSLTTSSSTSTSSTTTSTSTSLTTSSSTSTTTTSTSITTSTSTSSTTTSSSTSITTSTSTSTTTTSTSTSLTTSSSTSTSTTTTSTSTSITTSTSTTTTSTSTSLTTSTSTSTSTTTTSTSTSITTSTSTSTTSTSTSHTTSTSTSTTTTSTSTSITTSTSTTSSTSTSTTYTTAMSYAVEKTRQMGPLRSSYD